MKKQSMITVILVSIVFVILTGWNLFAPKADYSDSERRVLAKFPALESDKILSGSFSSDFESYATDTFPMRDFWRSIKAYTRKAMLYLDNNDLYTHDGHIAKLEYIQNDEMLKHAAGLFNQIKETYLGDAPTYFAMIPDKHLYLAEQLGYPSLDYEAFKAYFVNQMKDIQWIDLYDQLEIADYYHTDSHWRQNQLIDVAKTIAQAMGTDLQDSYEVRQADVDFFGVYAGQSALHVEPDTIEYLVNDTIQALEVEGASAVYDTKKLSSKDPYEMFLSGNQPLVTLRNPNAGNSKRLIIFRDSFASSLTPLLSEAYAEITLIDLRYISSDMLEEYVDFQDAEILFLYSISMLNNSLAMK